MMAPKKKSHSDAEPKKRGRPTDIERAIRAGHQKRLPFGKAGSSSSEPQASVACDKALREHVT